MAGEKLTKARLVQIIIIFIVLLSAFIWRTITHDNQQDSTALYQFNLPNNIESTNLVLDS